MILLLPHLSSAPPKTPTCSCPGSWYLVYLDTPVPALPELALHCDSGTHLRRLFLGETPLHILTRHFTSSLSGVTASILGYFLHYLATLSKLSILISQPHNYYQILPSLSKCSRFTHNCISQHTEEPLTVCSREICRLFNKCLLISSSLPLLPALLLLPPHWESEHMKGNFHKPPYTGASFPEVDWVVDPMYSHSLKGIPLAILPGLLFFISFVSLLSHSHQHICFHFSPFKNIVVCHLMPGTHYDKSIVRQFYYYVNIAECGETNVGCGYTHWGS